jgi:predicted O-methyltransferase YrrM
MRLEDVHGKVADTPHMTPAQAAKIYQHFAKYRPRDVLELGFAHGVSSCYMAGALEESGGGHLTTIDRGSAERRQPNIYELLEGCGLTHLVTVALTETSYTWELMAYLEAGPQPRFDFVYVDGAHLWDVDGFAFFLLDRLLEPGGWVLFDDLNWTLDTSPSLKDAEWVLRLPSHQRTTPQIRKVYELLVRTHELYGEFRDEEGWGWARKTR